MSSNQNSAYGFGIATQTQSGQILECSFYSLGVGSAPAASSSDDYKSLEGDDQIRRVKRVAVVVNIDLTDQPKDVADAYLRLHLLSHRVVKPHGLNLDGIFAILSKAEFT